MPLMLYSVVVIDHPKNITEICQVHRKCQIVIRFTFMHSVKKVRARQCPTMVHTTFTWGILAPDNTVDILTE